MAALGGEVSPARVFWATLVATGYGNGCRRRRGLGRSSPRVQVGLGGRAGGVVVVGRRRRTAELEGGAAAGRLRPSDHLGSTPGGCCGMLRGQGGSGVAGGEKSGGGPLTCGGAEGSVRRSDAGRRWISAGAGLQGAAG